MWIYINNLDQVNWLAENEKWAWHLYLFSMTRVKIPHPFQIVSQSDYLIVDCGYKFMYWMTNSADPDQLASIEANWSGSTLCKGRVYSDLQKPTDLDLHCLSLSMSVCSNNLDQIIWLAVRSGRGILICPAWQGLNLSINTLKFVDHHSSR